MNAVMRMSKEVSELRSKVSKLEEENEELRK